MDINNTVNQTNSTPALITSGPVIDAINGKVFLNNLLPSFIYMVLSLSIGTLGNLLVIYVYYCKRSKGTSRAFILALAVFDLIHCLFSMTIELDLLLNFIKFDKPFPCKLSRYVSAFCTNSTTVVLIAIAVDRFKKICKPMLSSLSIRAAHRIIAFAVFFGLVSATPMAVLYGSQTVVLGTGLAGMTCSIANIYLKTFYPTGLIIFIFLGHLVSDIIFLTLYSCVGTAVCNQKKTRRSLREHYGPNEPIENGEVTSSLSIGEQDSGHQENTTPLKRKPSVDFSISTGNKFNRNRSIDRRQRYGNRSFSERGSIDKGRKFSLVSLTRSFRRRRSSESSIGSLGRGQFIAGKTTMMLFLVTLVFIMSYLPFCVIVSLRVTDKYLYFRLNDVSKAVYQLFLRSYFLSSVLNPVVYCFVSVQFRKQALFLLVKCFPKF